MSALSNRNPGQLQSINGRIFTGSGAGAEFIRIPWVRKQIKEKLGFEPYPGTLNIRFAKQQEKELRWIQEHSKGVEITPEKGYLKARCISATIMGSILGAIVIPEKADYPANVLEVIAPVPLREMFSLQDGSEVKLTMHA